LSGGYKLYGSEGASDRWYFNLAIELPTDKFVDGQIIYQWVTYEDENQSPELTGAVACKIEVGDYSKTSADQWKGVTNLSS